MQRFEKAGIALLVLLLVALPTALHGWSATLAGNICMASLLASGLTLMRWRTRPRLVAVLGGSPWFLVAVLGQDAWFPEAALAIMSGLAAVVAPGRVGRRGWPRSAWAATCTSSGSFCGPPARSLW